VQPGRWFLPTPYGTQPPPEGVFEGEDLVVLTTTNSNLGLQRLGGRAAKWSRGGHLWFRPTRVGDYFEVSVPVRIAGRKRIAAYLTHAYNYSIFQLSVDGQKLGKPYDGYHGLAPGDRTVLRSGEVTFGEVDMTAGEHVFRFEVVGRNPKSRGFMIGLDVLEVLDAGK
jgi:hypothetical protein